MAAVTGNAPAPAVSCAPTTCPCVHPGVQAEIIQQCQRGDRSIAQVAKGFDLTETAVRE
ncbi:hypothetical protein [Lentzea xinjiangensis]|uniref:hypothetical protein n=1 Tax=Lentzea xinjiangensis TaxID=402600 RepID=UPI0015A706DA|nr:hypothetical protein [Lentzea xinjiangensis]